MVKYIKQHDSYSCGPVAIANVYRWLERPSPSLKKLSQVVRCQKPHGTQPHHFSIGLITLTKPFLAIDWFGKNSIHHIQKHIQKGGAVVINFQVAEECPRHYALVVGISKTGKSFHVVNILPTKSGSPVYRMSLKRFEFACLRFGTELCWYLKLKKKVKRD